MRRMLRSASFLVAVTVLASGCGYNSLQGLDEQVNKAKGQIEVQLQRRAALIPHLVATVKGVASCVSIAGSAIDQIVLKSRRRPLSEM